MDLIFIEFNLFMIWFNLFDVDLFDGLILVSILWGVWWIEVNFLLIIFDDLVK